jgi:prepilin-type processing-associated H-X9-DG protein
MNPHPASHYPTRRSGVTLVEATVALVVVVVVVILAMPVLTKFRERARRLACTANLHQIGQAMERYRSADSSQAIPSGATYDKVTRSSGTSWWLELMPYTDMKQIAQDWKKGANAGDFGGTTENPNILAADGYRNSAFFCPSSPLPPMNDPTRHVSEANRRALAGRTPAGIAVPMYAALAGGAPDARNIDLSKSLKQPNGRNTRDGKYGVLSSSGSMPIGIKVSEPGVTDTKSKTIMIVEQSDYSRNDAFDPPDLYDLRSAWPKGVFMGSTGEYGPLKMSAEDLNGSGEERAWNVTTIRYGINTAKAYELAGVVTDPPAPRPPKKGEQPPPLPPYPPEGYGPGHNHGIFSAHPGGAHVTMFDGSVPFLNEAIDLAILLELSTRDDGLDSGEF